MRKVLFLCTGNYFRSRFAEMLFNARASLRQLNWRADSRGLALEKGVNNIGPISKYALEALEQRDIPPPPNLRRPMQATVNDFQEADVIIALKASEHRPYLVQRYPGWAEQVEYWNITDVIPTADYNPLAEIEAQIEALIEELAVLESARSRRQRR